MPMCHPLRSWSLSATADVMDRCCISITSTSPEHLPHRHRWRPLPQVLQLSVRTAALTLRITAPTTRQAGPGRSPVEHQPVPPYKTRPTSVSTRQGHILYHSLQPTLTEAAPLRKYLR